MEFTVTACSEKMEMHQLCNALFRAFSLQRPPPHPHPLGPINPSLILHKTYRHVSQVNKLSALTWTIFSLVVFLAN